MSDPGDLTRGEVALAVAELHAGYGRRPALRGITFAARAGERVGVLGPNGAGKTTLFRVLLGELGATHGSHSGARCAIVPQTERSRLDYPVSALDVAVMGAVAGLPWWRRPGRAERRSAREALAAVGLGDHVDSTFGVLSAGQRQRVLVARALVQDAPVLLLDEPFNGIDTPGAELLERVLASLAAQGRALLIATHDLAQARRWEQVLCLNGRQVAFGPPRATLTRDVLRRTYGEALVELDGGGEAIVAARPHECAR